MTRTAGRLHMGPMRRTLRATALALPVTLAACTAVVGAGATARATCHGLPVTTTQDRGVITGTPGRDIIRLRAGATVRTGAGPDIVCGSPAADDIRTGAGDDVVLGRGGPDDIRTGAGRDTAFGDAGDDRMDGGSGRDMLVGGAGHDRITAQVIMEAGEHQIAGDIAAPGTRAISLVVRPGALWSMWMNGMAFAGSWANMQSPGVPMPWAAGVQVLSIAFQPQMVNAVVFTDATWVYTAQPPMVLSGGVLVPQAADVVPNFSVVPDAVGLVAPGQSGSVGATGTIAVGPPYLSGLVGLVNQSPLPVTGGLAGSVVTNGVTVSSPTPMTAAVVEPGQVLPMKPPGGLTLFVTQGLPTWAELQTGRVITPPGAPSITLSLPPGGATAAVSYSTGGGFQTD